MAGPGGKGPGGPGGKGPGRHGAPIQKPRDANVFKRSSLFLVSCLYHKNIEEYLLLNL